MSNVIRLGPPLIRPPNPSLIALLQQMLDEATSGNLQTLMAVGVTADGSIIKASAARRIGSISCTWERWKT